MARVNVANVVPKCLPCTWRRVMPQLSTSSPPIVRHGHKAVAVNGNLMVIFGGGKSGNNGIIDDLHAFNITINTWFKPPVQGDIPLGRAAHSFAVDDNNFILMFGGILESGEYSNELYRLDTTLWKWTKLKPMETFCGDFPCPRIGSSLTWMPSNKTYILFGGLGNKSDCIQGDEHLHLNDLFSLEVRPDNNLSSKWNSILPGGQLPPPRESHTSVSFTNAVTGINRLVVFGGTNGFRRFGDVWFLDVDTMSWSKPSIRGIPPLPRSMHTATMIGPRMVVFGGWLHLMDEDPRVTQASKEWKCTNSLACLNLESKTWEKPELLDVFEDFVPRARTGHCAVALNSRLYVWSGRDGYRTLKNGEQAFFRDLWYLELQKPSAPLRLKLINLTSISLEICWDADPISDVYILQIQKIKTLPKKKKHVRKSDHVDDTPCSSDMLMSSILNMPTISLIPSTIQEFEPTVEDTLRPPPTKKMRPSAATVQDKTPQSVIPSATSEIFQTTQAIFVTEAAHSSTNLARTVPTTFLTKPSSSSMKSLVSLSTHSPIVSTEQPISLINLDQKTKPSATSSNEPEICSTMPEILFNKSGTLTTTTWTYSRAASSKSVVSSGSELLQPGAVSGVEKISKDTGTIDLIGDCSMNSNEVVGRLVKAGEEKIIPAKILYLNKGFEKESAQFIDGVVREGIKLTALKGEMVKIIPRTAIVLKLPRSTSVSGKMILTPLNHFPLRLVGHETSKKYLYYAPKLVEDTKPGLSDGVKDDTKRNETLKDLITARDFLVNDGVSESILHNVNPMAALGRSSNNTSTSFNNALPSVVYCLDGSNNVSQPVTSSTFTEQHVRPSQNMKNVPTKYLNPPLIHDMIPVKLSEVIKREKEPKKCPADTTSELGLHYSVCNANKVCESSLKPSMIHADEITTTSIIEPSSDPESQCFFPEELLFDKTASKDRIDLPWESRVKVKSTPDESKFQSDAENLLMMLEEPLVPTVSKQPKNPEVENFNLQQPAKTPSIPGTSISRKRNIEAVNVNPSCGRLSEVNATSAGNSSVEGFLPSLESLIKPHWHSVGMFKSVSNVIESYYITKKRSTTEDDVNLELDSTSLKKMDLEPNTVYVFRVRSMNSCGCGPWSKVSFFKTCSKVYHGQPRSVSLKKTQKGVIHLLWKPPENPRGIIVQYRVCMLTSTVNASSEKDRKKLFHSEIVYQGIEPWCIIKEEMISRAFICEFGSPAILLEVSAKNAKKGYGPEVIIRWLQ